MLEFPREDADWDSLAANSISLKSSTSVHVLLSSTSTVATAPSFYCSFLRNLSLSFDVFAWESPPLWVSTESQDMGTEREREKEANRKRVDESTQHWELPKLQAKEPLRREGNSKNRNPNSLRTRSATLSKIVLVLRINVHFLMFFRFLFYFLINRDDSQNFFFLSSYNHFYWRHISAHTLSKWVDSLRGSNKTQFFQKILTIDLRSKLFLAITSKHFFSFSQQNYPNIAWNIFLCRKFNYQAKKL